ncbi:preprotein translocase subunit SecE [Actinobacillus porcinus]|uniref:Protein translocase subunit SecE n=1 Tax=Actinobacillus porcinus TaxID=51048 RepID=A0ABY6TMF4_9PAST|nr:preprotein translocase subunit SecE [Actinobacillus porcinus]MCI5763610.1 preprotein translocase subunit SecE [Actinobacillus porcinus]MDD7546099.1 preprotein translocase subunit SecE [Actinobacillus porcinus]MDY5421550.1 preprotein translocase subunit SecE [Actinobacillus porcinus]MDY5849134.1 preprotein translocase subunit SecE [Actinobacillus porcinus]MDY6215041.1 preprotein translocase subunit SecE [Actinobacillus porcinus]
MALVADKKKDIEEVGQKSKGVNVFLWVLSLIIVLVASVGNVVFAEQFSTPIRVVAIFVLLVLALVFAALTNEGKRALNFFSESRVELRRIVWPTRPETMQTTFIIIAATVLLSLILWALDSIIIAVLNFLTNLRF